MMPDQARKWLRQQSKDYYAAGFEALVKRWCIVSVLVEDMARNKYIFAGSNITFFTFHISF
jgi:hypothetical protein